MSDDEDAARTTHAQQDEYEADEEEQDPDCPFPNVIEHLDIELGHPNHPIAALHIATPALSSSAARSKVLKRNAVVAVAGSDGRVLLLRIPLALPSPDSKEELLSDISDSVIELSSGGPIPSDLSVKYVATAQQSNLPREVDDSDGHLYIASASKALHIWSVAVASDFLISTKNNLLRRVPLPAAAAKVAFQPSTRSAQLLLLDPTGVVRLYDPHAPTTHSRRPGSSDSALNDATKHDSSGKWVMAYLAPYHAAKEPTETAATMAQRKRILDAGWVLSGRAIVVLLQNGEWGVWDLYSTLPGKRVEEFAIRGFLDTSSHAETADPSKQRGSTKLAPMTPNTRKSKAEQLFTGTPKIPGVAPRGGISISAINTRSGHADESVAIWYGSDVYSITSMQSFWQRSTTKDGGFGSLYSPGLSHITDINLHNENITTVAHFPIQASSAGLGQMNTQRDLIVSAEHRAIILQSSRPAGAPHQLFQQQLTERPALQDQQMLDAGALDIDGMDRMLDSMAGNAPTRRVLFAAD